MAKPNDVAIYFDSSLCTGCKGCQVASHGKILIY